MAAQRDNVNNRGDILSDEINDNPLDAIIDTEQDQVSTMDKQDLHNFILL